jgi:hypothetical protein
VLSVGLQQLKLDMRYRVKVIEMNDAEIYHQMNGTQSSPSTSETTELIHSSEDDHHKPPQVLFKPKISNDINSKNVRYKYRQVDTDDNNNNFLSNEIVPTLEYGDNKLRQNWQFEIRKLTFEDAGTYQCSLSLIKPITKNITLQVIRKFNLIFNFFF